MSTYYGTLLVVKTFTLWFGFVVAFWCLPGLPPTGSADNVMCRMSRAMTPKNPARLWYLELSAQCAVRGNMMCRFSLFLRQVLAREIGDRHGREARLFTCLMDGFASQALSQSVPAFCRSCLYLWMDTY
jgi:hypothetical protein